MVHPLTSFQQLQMHDTSKGPRSHISQSAQPSSYCPAEHAHLSKHATCHLTHFRIVLTCLQHSLHVNETGQPHIVVLERSPAFFLTPRIFLVLFFLSLICFLDLLTGASANPFCKDSGKMMRSQQLSRLSPNPLSG